MSALRNTAVGGRLTVAWVIFALLVPLEANAEWVISGYFGKADTPTTDVKFAEPGGTDLTFHDVSWDDDSFGKAAYFGIRGTRWFERHPHWGLAVDFTHAKMLAHLDDTVSVTGTRAGTPVAGPERLGDTFDVLEFSDGHNLLTVNGLRRWFFEDAPDRTFLSRLQPYVGIGAGLAIPHVEVTTANGRTFEYQVVGFAAQGLAGLAYGVFENVSIFTEYKLSWADMDCDLGPGATLKVRPWTHHLVFGASYSFW